MIGYVDVLDDMHLEMDIVIHSFPENDYTVLLQSNRSNIFQIGPGYPSLSIHRDSGSPDAFATGFYIYFENPNGLRGQGTIQMYGIANLVGGVLVIGDIYHIEIDYSLFTFTVIINDEMVWNETKNEHVPERMIPFYASSGPLEVANVTISNLTVTTTYTMFPTPEPSGPSTIAPGLAVHVSAMLWNVVCW